MTKEEILKEIIEALIEHRDSVVNMIDDGYTSDDIIKLCEPIDENIKSTLLLFIDEVEDDENKFKI